MALETTDVHVAGAAVRLVIGGVPAVSGATLTERAESLEQAAGRDLVALCREPRGHAGTFVAVLAEPDEIDTDTGLLFFDGDGMVRFCGEALIGAVAAALERGLIGPRRHDVVSIQTLVGPVRSRRLAVRDGSIAIGYTGAPAMVVQSNHPVPRGARRVHADLVWADSTLVAIVDAEAAGAPLVPTRVLELQRAGRELVIALDQGLRVSDPESGSPVSVASSAPRRSRAQTS